MISLKMRFPKNLCLIVGNRTKIASNISMVVISVYNNELICSVKCENMSVSGGWTYSLSKHFLHVCDGVHLCNPDLVRHSSLDCGWTQPLVTYYYSFSCCSKYWFIKGFSIWAPWHLVKYHQVCRSEERDREGGGQIGSPGTVDHPHPPPPHPSPTHTLLSPAYLSV